MIQKDLNDENKEIKSKAYELYQKHGFKDGNDFVDWLEAEKQVGEKSRSKRIKRSRNFFFHHSGIIVRYHCDPADYASHEKPSGASIRTELCCAEGYRACA